MTSFKSQLLAVPPMERDAWVDRALGFSEVPDDGPELPRDGVPYLPAPVASILEFVQRGKIDAGDVVVDVGAGVGRAASLIHLLSGAEVIAVEVQPRLVELGRRLAPSIEFVEADAARCPEADAYFLYCPFSGDRLDRWLESHRARVIGCVDMPALSRPWLRAEPGRAVDLYWGK
ncbi:MAG: methyltransferase domain-containing protein [Archangium sp.]